MEQLTNMPVWAQLLSMGSFMFASGVLMTRIPLAPAIILSFFYLCGWFGTFAEMPNFTLKNPSFWLCLQIALFLIVCVLFATVNDQGPIVGMGWGGFVVMGVLGIAFCVGGGLSIIVNLYKYLQLLIFCFSKVNFAVLGVLFFVGGIVFGGYSFARPYISDILPPVSLWLGLSYIAMALLSVLACGVVLWGIAKGMPSLSLIAAFLCVAALLCEYPLYRYAHVRGPQAKEIITAVEKGDTAKVKSLLEQKNLIKMRDKDGNTSLIIASRSGRLDMVQELLAHKADVNAVNSREVTALFEACQQGDIEIVKALLAAGADVNKGAPALVVALEKGHNEIARMLLDSNADVNKASYNGGTALMEAVGKNEKEIVKLLLDKGANVNAQDSEGDTALLLSSRGWEKQADIVTMLLNKGADPNKTNRLGRTVLQLTLGKKTKEEEAKLLYQAGGRLGRIPLYNDIEIRDAEFMMIGACSNGFTEVVGQLLQAGVKPTTHHAVIAARKGNTEVLKQLLDAGWNINEPDEGGEGPLSSAVSLGHLEAVRLLIAAGANVNTKNNEGETPLALAKERGFSEMVKLLESAGAKDSTDNYEKPILDSAQKGEHAENNKATTTLTSAINTPDKFGQTPLLKAVEKGQTEEVKNLIAQGADVNFVNHFKESILMVAVRKNKPEIVKLLIQAGADVNYKDVFGKSILKVATQKGFVEIISLLKSAGAKE